MKITNISVLMNLSSGGLIEDIDVQINTTMYYDLRLLFLIVAVFITLRMVEIYVKRVGIYNPTIDIV